jgi:hypothetical protein
MEHRWSVRQPVGGRVVVHCARSGVLFGAIQDLSLGGLMARFEQHTLTVNSPVTLKVSLPSSPTNYHRIPAMVVRSDVDRVGFMYLDLDTAARHELRYVLHLVEGFVLEQKWSEKIDAKITAEGARRAKEKDFSSAA